MLSEIDEKGKLANYLFEQGMYFESFDEYKICILWCDSYRNIFVEKMITLYRLHQMNQFISLFKQNTVIPDLVLKGKILKSVCCLANQLFDEAKYEDSLNLYRLIVGKDPSYCDRLIQKANSLFELEYFSKSLEEFKYAISISSQYFPFLCDKAKLLLDRSLFVESYDWLKEIAHQDKRFTKQIAQSAQELFEVKTYQKSLEWSLLIIEYNQEQKEQLTNQINALFQQKLFSMCFIFLQAASDKCKNFFLPLMLNLANELFKMGEYKELVEWCLYLNSKNVDINDMVEKQLELLLGQTSKEQAIKLLKTQIQFNTKWIGKLFEVGEILFNDKQYEEARRLFKDIICYDQKYCDSFYKFSINFKTLAKQLFELQQYKQTLKWSSDAIWIDPNQLQAHYCFANQLFEMGKVEESFEWYKEAIWKDENVAVPLCEKANELFNQKKYQQALKWLSQSFYRYTNFLPLIYEEILKKACQLFDMYNYEESYKWFVAIIQQGQTISKMHQRAMALFDRQNFDVSLMWLRQIIQYESKYFESILNQANVLFQMQKFSQALKWYQCALSIDQKYSIEIQQKADILIQKGKNERAQEWLRCLKQ